MSQEYLDLRLHSTDEGNCRVYYQASSKDGERKYLFCFQEQVRGEFQLYICSSDGEPDREYHMKSAISRIDKVPAVEGPTTKPFVEWVQREVEAGRLAKVTIQ